MIDMYSYTNDKFLSQRQKSTFMDSCLDMRLDSRSLIVRSHNHFLYSKFRGCRADGENRRAGWPAHQFAFVPNFVQLFVGTLHPHCSCPSSILADRCRYNKRKRPGKALTVVFQLRYSRLDVYDYRGSTTFIAQSDETWVSTDFSRDIAFVRTPSGSESGCFPESYLYWTSIM